MPRYLVLLGTNVDRDRCLREGEAALAAATRVVARSRVVDSEAVGCASSPRFYNRALLIEDDRDPAALVDLLHEVEGRLGRERTSDRNAPRTLDLDLLLALDAGGRPLADPAPHRDLVRFHHAAVPAAEVLPGVVVPGDGRALAAVVADLGPLPPGFHLIDTEA